MFSLGRDEDNTPPSHRKNGVATTYVSRDPKQCVFNIETLKIGSTKHATDSTSGSAMHLVII